MSIPSFKNISQHLTRERISLLFILVVGTFLRLWNINWGLPDLHEEATPLVTAWKMWNWGGTGVHLNPHFFNYPALSFYVLFLIQGIQYLIGSILDMYSNMQTFGATLSPFIIPARLVIGLFDIGSIWAIYKLGKEVIDEKTGLIAAAFVAVNPLHITQAHYITVDTPLTFFVLLALLYIHRAYRQPSTKHYLLVGLCIGLAAATKYTGAFLLVVLLTLHLLRSDSLTKTVRSLTDLRLLKSVVLSLVVFFCINPYILTSFDEFLKDFTYERYHVAEGHLGIDASQSTVDYYLFNVLPTNFGWLLFLLVPITIAYAIIKKEKHLLLLLAFPVIYIAIISTWEMRVERYILPVFPVLLLISATGLRTLWMRFQSSFQQSSPKNLSIAFAAVVGTLVLYQPMTKAIEFQKSIVLPDTRTDAKEWIEQNVAPGSYIATGPFGIQIPETTYHVLYIPFLILDVAGVAPFYDTRWYEDFELLIASDYDYDRYAQEPKKYADFLPYYDSLKTHWSLLAEIKPAENQQGPTIWFYTYPRTERKEMFDPAMIERLHDTPESSKVSYFYNNLSLALEQKRKFMKCEQVLREILTVEVNNLSARNSLANTLFQLENYQGALLQVQRSIRANPSQAELFSFAGDILQKMGRDQEAELSYLKAIEINQFIAAPYQALMTFYTEHSDKEKLTGILERYIGILPPKSNEAKILQEQLKNLKNPS